MVRVMAVAATVISNGHGNGDSNGNGDIGSNTNNGGSIAVAGSDCNHSNVNSDGIDDSSGVGTKKAMRMKGQEEDNRQ